MLSRIPQKSLLNSVSKPQHSAKTTNVTGVLNDHDYMDTLHITSECKASSSCKEAQASSQQTIDVLKETICGLEDSLERLTLQSEDLKYQNTILEQSVSAMKETNKLPHVCIEKITTDKLMALHTGLPTVRTFKWVSKELHPAAKNMQYWKGPNSMQNEKEEVAR